MNPNLLSGLVKAINKANELAPIKPGAWTRLRANANAQTSRVTLPVHSHQAIAPAVLAVEANLLLACASQDKLIIGQRTFFLGTLGSPQVQPSTAII